MSIRFADSGVGNGRLSTARMGTLTMRMIRACRRPWARRLPPAGRLAAAFPLAGVLLAALPLAALLLAGFPLAGVLLVGLLMDGLLVTSGSLPCGTFVLHLT